MTDTVEAIPCRKILLVDDDRRLREAIKIRLKKIGCHCICCGNVSEAMTHFTLGGVDLVITDITMPEIDGLGFVGLIRCHSKIPIIVVTGHSTAYAQNLSEYPNVRVIEKPFEMEILITQIRELVPQAENSIDF